MIFIIVVVLVGLRLKSKQFWKYGISAIAYQIVMTYLFQARGSLENLMLDGPVTRMIRKATSDGPVMGVFGLFVIIITWGGMLFLINKGYRKAKLEKVKSS